MVHFSFPSVFLPGDLDMPDHILGLYVVIPWRERFAEEWSAAGDVCQHPEVEVTMCDSAEHHWH